MIVHLQTLESANWNLTVGWCYQCNVPVSGNLNCGICGEKTLKIPVGNGEMKPIFQKEREFYKQIIERSLGKNRAALLDVGLSFCSRRGEIILDGKKVFSIRFDQDTDSWSARLMKQFEKHPFEPKGTNERDLLKANIQIIKRKETQALAFLRQSIITNCGLPFVVSFSGGKDSTVVLALARGLHKNPTPLFLNTTIEFMETVDYARDLCDKWKLDLIEITPDSEFLDLVEQLGPPSRLMKWCCQTQKFGPLNRFISKEYPEGVLMASGLRRAESNIRREFAREQTNPHIPKQKLIFPILDWGSLDVWLYIMWKDIPYNPLYNYGYSRVGCWACPEKSKRDSALIKQTHPNLIDIFHDLLRQFASSRKLSDVDNWIEKGIWKRWRTKWQRTAGCITQPCTEAPGKLYTIEDHTFMKQATEFLKVFGRIRTSPIGSIIDGSEVHIVITQNRIRAVVDNKKILANLEKQIKRALNCVACGACTGACPEGALAVVDGTVHISDDCIHCLKCLNSTGIRMNCIALNYKPDIISVETANAIPS